jgi:arginine repressor
LLGEVFLWMVRREGQAVPQPSDSRVFDQVEIREVQPQNEEVRMTDDDAKRHLSDKQREMWEEAVRVRDSVNNNVRLRSIPIAAPTVLALLRELARKTAALGSLTDAIENMRVPRTIADAGLQVLVTIGPVVERARAALAPPPTEGDPA